MLLQTGLLLAAAAATSPPFKTAVGLRPAARGLQGECPVLTKIKKDDCTEALFSAQHRLNPANSTRQLDQARQ